ncbi:Na+-driven multidrug efflux pump [Oceanospirillum multiglobuliferum]|nr:Na+-driven multidrug efflux pump [Oceanospirillum multiglobuliferum]
MAAGLVTIPHLIEAIGVEMFGILSIAWMVVGYFGILDMGLGRALTQRLAYNLGMDRTQYIKPLVNTAILILLLLGGLGSIIVHYFSEDLIYSILNISEQYKSEVLKGTFWIIITIPIVIISTALFGVLEGQQYFGWTAIVRTPLNLLMFFSPLFIIQWSSKLDHILLSLFLVRLFGLLSLITIVFNTLRPYPKGVYEKTELLALLHYGSWITISNIISPIMVYFDRFYIAAALSASIVAFYTTPLDFLTKMLLLPSALVGVMFTSFSNEWSSKRKSAIDKYRKSILAIFLSMLPTSIIIFLYADTGLSIWLGAEFANQSYMYAQILIIGIFFNSMAMVPHALIQGAGRSDITAKFHLLELPIFILSLWFFIEHYGLMGAAIAWAIRTFIDSVLLFIYAERLIRTK